MRRDPPKEINRIRIRAVDSRPNQPFPQPDPQGYDESEEDTHVDGHVVYFGLDRVPSSHEATRIPSSESSSGFPAWPTGQPPQAPAAEPSMAASAAAVAAAAPVRRPADPPPLNQPDPQAVWPGSSTPPQAAQVPAWPTPQAAHASAGWPTTQGAQPAPVSSPSFSWPTTPPSASGSMPPPTASAGFPPPYASGATATASMSGAYRATVTSSQAVPKAPTLSPRTATYGHPGTKGESLGSWVLIAGAVAFAIFIGGTMGIGLLRLGLSVTNGPSTYTRTPPTLPEYAGAAPVRPPPAPFVIAPPPVYTYEHAPDVTVATDVSEARLQLAQAQMQGDPKLVALWSDRVTRLSNDPYTFLNNAAYLSAANATDAAVYWLTRAVDEVGASPRALIEDNRFAHLWDDARWDDLAQWAVARERYFGAHPDPTAVAWLPDGREVRWIGKPEPEPPPPVLEDNDLEAQAPPPPKAKKPPYPVALVWLSAPDSDTEQTSPWAGAMATAWSIPVIAIDGPVHVGPHANAWNTDSVRARAHVEDMIHNLGDLGARFERAVLVGSGAAGRVALDLAIRNPSRFAGVLAISPNLGPLGGLSSSSALIARDQQVLITSPRLEPDELTSLRAMRAQLIQAGLQAQMAVDTELWPDTLPADDRNRMLDWLSAFVPTPNTPLFPPLTRQLDGPLPEAPLRTPITVVETPAPVEAQPQDAVESVEADEAIPTEATTAQPAGDAVPTHASRAPAVAEAAPKSAPSPKAPATQAPRAPKPATQAPVIQVLSSPKAPRTQTAQPTPSSDEAPVITVITPQSENHGASDVQVIP